MQQSQQGGLRVLRLYRLGNCLSWGHWMDLLQLLAQRADHGDLAGRRGPQRHRLPHQHRDLLPQLCLHPRVCPQRAQPSLRALLPQLRDDQSVYNLLVQDGGSSGVKLQGTVQSEPMDPLEHATNFETSRDHKTCSIPQQWSSVKGDEKGSDWTSKLRRVHPCGRGRSP